MAQLGMVLYHGIDNGAELKTYGRIAEDLGYDSLWVTERYFHEETFSLLGFLAAATERLRLGVGVVNPYTRHPALLAMGAATLARISAVAMLGMGRSDRLSSRTVKFLLRHVTPGRGGHPHAYTAFR